MAVMWHLTFQLDGLPISVRRADELPEDPPPGLIRYVELAHGAWTTVPATAPIGTEGVEWPRPCVWKDVIGCRGSMAYVEHVTKPVIWLGEKTYPAGWQCDSCANEEVGGFGSLTIDSIERE